MFVITSIPNIFEVEVIFQNVVQNSFYEIAASCLLAMTGWIELIVLKNPQCTNPPSLRAE